MIKYYPMTDLTPTQDLMALPRKYPPELTIKLDDPNIGSDLQTLVDNYGEYAVLILNYKKGIEAQLVTMAICTIDGLGRFMKKVPISFVKDYLQDDEYEYIQQFDSAIVCASPLDAPMALTLADLALAEYKYFQGKLSILISLESGLGLTKERIIDIVGEMVRKLCVQTSLFEQKIEKVCIMPVAWTNYCEGSENITIDQASAKIRDYAKHCNVIYPTIKRASDEEIAAVFSIYEILVQEGHQDLATQFIRNILLSPIFAGLAHKSEIFAKVKIPWEVFGPTMFKWLLSEETSAMTKNYDKVSIDMPYIFTLDKILALGVPNCPQSVAEAENRLNELIGGYLHALEWDSHTAITGSCIAASLIITKRESDLSRKTWRSFQTTDEFKKLKDNVPIKFYAWRDQEYEKNKSLSWYRKKLETYEEWLTKFFNTEYQEWKATESNGYEDYISSHYPTKKTVPQNRGEYCIMTNMLRNYPNAILTLGEIENENDQQFITMYVEHGEQKCSTRLELLDGADVDMSIDVESTEQFDKIVEKHYSVIKKYYPTAILTKIKRGVDLDKYNWSITCKENLEFRSVECYMANLCHMTTHHVGAVRGAYTKILSEKPQFITTGSFVITMASLASPNYKYFASKKISPVEVIVKYYMRGFNLHGFPNAIQTAILNVIKNDPLWSYDDYYSRYTNTYAYPALFGKGNFSVFSIEQERLNMQHAIAKTGLYEPY